jgi:hypothetical protein
MRCHVVQPYGPPGDYRKATVVATCVSAEVAWEYLDGERARMAANGVAPDVMELVVVDESPRAVQRPPQRNHRRDEGA